MLRESSRKGTPGSIEEESCSICLCQNTDILVCTRCKAVVCQKCSNCSEIQTLTSEHEKLKNENEDLKSQIFQLNEKNESFKKQLESHIREIDRLMHLLSSTDGNSSVRSQGTPTNDSSFSDSNSYDKDKMDCQIREKQEFADLLKIINTQEEKIHQLTKKSNFSSKCDEYYSYLQSTTSLMSTVMNGMNLDRTEIDLSWISLKSSQIKQLVEFRFLHSIVEFNLNCNNIDAKGIKYLASSNYLENLRVLYLMNNQINDAGMKYLGESTNLKSLIELYLNCNKIGSQGMKYLSVTTNFKSLKILFLTNNNLGSEGIFYLLKCCFASQLSVLDLRFNNITTLGVKYLSESSIIENLDFIDIRYNNIGAEGLTYLTQKNLKSKMKNFDYLVNKKQASTVKNYKGNNTIAKASTEFLEELYCLSEGKTSSRSFCDSGMGKQTTQTASQAAAKGNVMKSKAFSSVFSHK